MGWHGQQPRIPSLGTSDPAGYLPRSRILAYTLTSWPSAPHTKQGSGPTHNTPSQSGQNILPLSPVVV